MSQKYEDTQFDPSEEIALKYWAKEEEKSYLEICNRVAAYMQVNDENIGLSYNDIMMQLFEKKFLPNSPVFMNAGTERKSLAACFVLPLDDNMESIFDTAKNMALVMKEGGGVGISLSHLRPEGSPVKHTRGVSSGPVSFLKVYDSVVDTVKQGGTRRGAALANLRVDHPDILKFIKCKSVEGAISNFNLSVAITDEFIQAYLRKEKFTLRNPSRPSDDFTLIDPDIIMEAIIDGMWQNGEPGVQFIDTINYIKLNTRAARYKQFNTGIETSNPCSEAYLRPNESCNLGAINLYKFIVPFWKSHADMYWELVNWEDLKSTVQFAVKFLNRVIDLSVAPLADIDRVTKESRKIGLGIMGLADTLSAVGIPYDSEDAFVFTVKILKFIQAEAEKTSDNFNYNNAMLTLIAPTGTTGLVANVSQGIEPHFRLVYERNSVKVGKIQMMCRSLKDFLIDQKDAMYQKFLEEKISLKDFMDYIHNKKFATNWDHAEFSEIWKTSDEISPDKHLEMLSVVQSCVDNGVSKTINLPNETTRESLRDLLIKAWALRIKGFTVYRDGSRNSQVLSAIESESKTKSKPIIEPELEISKDTPQEIKRARPITTQGVTTKIKIGCGNLYVTTNADNNGACEVFTHLGRSGGCPSQSEATARLISLCLRSGIAVTEVVEQLIGIRCLSTISNGKTGKMEDGTSVLSCPDAIGKCLKMFDEKSQILQSAPNYEISTEGLNASIRKCPKCGEEVQRASGCLVCLACGYSKCG